MNIWLAIAGAAVATYAPRGIGVLLAGRIDTQSAAFRWVSAVAYALLAALIAQLIVVPLGPLQHTSLADRLVATVAALAVFLLTRRNLLLGVAAGGATLSLLSLVG
jgi:branched-subunit amino acid transport protein